MKTIRNTSKKEILTLVIEMLEEMSIIEKAVTYLKNEYDEVFAKADVLYTIAVAICDNPEFRTRFMGFDPYEYVDRMDSLKAEKAYWAMKRMKGSKNPDIYWMLQKNKTLLEFAANYSYINYDISVAFRNFQSEKPEYFFGNSEEGEDCFFENIGYYDLKNEKEDESLDLDIDYEVEYIYENLEQQLKAAEEDGDYSLKEDVLLPQMDELRKAYPHLNLGNK